MELSNYEYLYSRNFKTSFGGELLGNFIKNPYVFFKYWFDIYMNVLSLGIRFIHYHTLCTIHSLWSWVSILVIFLQETTFGEESINPLSVIYFPSCLKHIYEIGLSIMNLPKEFIHGIPKIISFWILVVHKISSLKCDPQGWFLIRVL